MSDELNLNLEENLEETTDETVDFDQEDMPEEVKKLNWGAFWCPFFWGLFNAKPSRAIVILALSLLAGGSLVAMIFVAFLGPVFVWILLAVFAVSFIALLILPYVFLFKGNAWAWREKHWESAEQFNKVQKLWGIFTFILFGLPGIAGFVLFIVSLVLAGSLMMATFGSVLSGDVSSLKNLNPNSIQQQNINLSDDHTLPAVSEDIAPSESSSENLSESENENYYANENNNSGEYSGAAAESESNNAAPSAPVAADTTNKVINNKDLIDNKDSAIITVGGHGRDNPFKPFYDQAFSGEFPPPDDVFKIDDTATNLMAIKIAGILYDPRDPSNASAIVNISNTDYMVKKGDDISGYKILVISKDSVAVKYGLNTYSAGIGETVNPAIQNNYANSGIVNINKKFAGNKK